MQRDRQIQTDTHRHKEETGRENDDRKRKDKLDRHTSAARNRFQQTRSTK